MTASQQRIQHGVLTIGLLIPGDGIARVIGKQGAGLKQIRENTCCKLQVGEATADNSLLRRVSITGFPQGIGMAVGQALMKVSDESNQMTVMIFIPSDLAGVVVGKAGANLKRVREFVGVRLELDR